MLKGIHFRLAVLTLAEIRRRMRPESAATAWFDDEIRSTRDTTS